MSGLRAFTMPKWGIEMTEGTIAEWMVKEGESLTRGQIITLIETDKITNEVEAEYEATVAKLIASAGETYPVGTLLGVFATGAASAADVDAFVAGFRPADASMASGSEQDEPAPAPKPAPVAEPQASVVIPADVAISPAARVLATTHGVEVAEIAGTGPRGRISFQDVDQAMRPAVAKPSADPVSIVVTTEAVDRLYASPLAKRLAVQHGVDLATISGTGARGRISKVDVLACIPQPEPEAVAPPPPAVRHERPTEGYEAVRMSPMRKAIARQLTLSKQTIPHFYLRTSVQVDALLAARAAAKRAVGEAPSVNDYVVRAVALALIEHPDVNVQVHDEEILRFHGADIAVAVSTPKGLLTPIVRGANGKSVARISHEIKALAERARAGKLQPEEFQGGSFSVSNLGMYGIEQFDAIINPPQGAILAVGAAVRRPVDAGHALAFATMMQVSLSCDHRAIDGAVGAQFLQTFRALIEDPDRLTS
jgi:pyruvate dehydrogenase E2 component (dihydrolipoamide acetyltransferase)